ncbi:MAG: thioredoxin fold domain-containing protein, partial [Acidobacteriaceae bacterium]
FYTTWCGWCKVLDHNTYTDETVTKLTDAKFVCVKIDAEKGEGIGLAKQYQISGYPTIVFFDEGGKEIDRVVGYEDPSRFVQSLRTVMAGGSKAILGEVERPNPTTDARKWLVAAIYYAQHQQDTKSLAAFKKVLVLDPSNKYGNNAEALYGVGFLSSGPDQERILDSALRTFPDEMDADQANMLLIRKDFLDKNPTLATRRIDEWAMKHPNDGAMFNFFAWSAAQAGAALDRADEYAKRAIQLAPSPIEKAGAIDTRAEVLYKQGKSQDASQLESSAIALLDPVEDKKLYDELEAQKAKFDKAIADTPAQTTPENH